MDRRRINRTPPARRNQGAEDAKVACGLPDMTREPRSGAAEFRWNPASQLVDPKFRIA